MAVTNIGLFGKRNVGKSSLINLIIGQDVAIVSDKAGTTTDPVKKRIEIFGIGPCQLIDTAGIDDEGELGKMRVGKTLEMLNQIDIAIMVLSANKLDKDEEKVLKKLIKMEIPAIVVHNQSDIIPLDPLFAERILSEFKIEVLEFSCCEMEEDAQKAYLEQLIAKIVEASRNSSFREKPIFEGVVSEGQTVVLVCPIDSEAPTGRLILPQVMAIRDLLDRKAIANVMLPESLPSYFAQGNSPDLVVTDSQIFGTVSKMVPAGVKLTSFSMLLARSKGAFDDYIKGSPQISNLKDGDRILILESCTHHSSCEDIGRVKLPALFRKFSGKRLEFDFVSGLDRIEKDFSCYALVAQCGGCMVTPRQLYNRLLPAIEAGVPVTNYGMAIAYMNGIFDRVVEPLVNIK